MLSLYLLIIFIYYLSLVIFIIYAIAPFAASGSTPWGTLCRNYLVVDPAQGSSAVGGALEPGMAIAIFYWSPRTADSVWEVRWRWVERCRWCSTGARNARIGIDREAVQVHAASPIGTHCLQF